MKQQKEKKTEKKQTESSSNSGKSFWAIVKKYCNRWFIDAFSGMAQGLFVTLIAGTIIKTLGTYLFKDTDFGAFLVMLGGFASIATGCGIGIGIANGLKANKLVMFSAAVAGMLGAYAEPILAGQNLSEIAVKSLANAAPGNPVSAYICSLMAVEIGNLVAGKTKLDILLVPLTCIFVAAIGVVASPGIAAAPVANAVDVPVSANAFLCISFNVPSTPLYVSTDVAHFEMAKKDTKAMIMHTTAMIHFFLSTYFSALVSRYTSI